MAETLYKTYEGMFLVDPGTTDFNAASEMINTILARSEGEIVSIKPWEDRRLAYEIKGRSRGLYVLVYFKADPEKIRDIERDCQLAEGVLRVLIIRRDKISEQEIAAETPATTVAAKAEEAATEASAEEVKAEEAATEAPAEEVKAEEAATEAPAAEVKAEEAAVEAPAAEVAEQDDSAETKTAE